MKFLLDKFRDPVSGLTHLAAALAAVIGLIVLLWYGHGDVTRAIALTVYGVSLVLLFSASAAYHLVKANPNVILRLRKFDHSAIYLLIAGTYTPICLTYFDGFWRWGLLGIVWGMAIVGIIIKLFFINAPRWLTAGVYLLMGWLSILAIKEMISAMPAGALVWVWLGGAAYTLGAIGYILKKPDLFPGVFGFHEVWHIFVILGSLCHYVAIAAYIAA